MDCDQSGLGAERLSKLPQAAGHPTHATFQLRESTVQRGADRQCRRMGLVVDQNHLFDLAAKHREKITGQPVTAA